MRYEIRRPAAVSAIAVLAAIVAFCPSWTCVPPEVGAAAHSCCPSSEHKSPGKQGSVPCDASSQTCPYLLLQKAKSVALPLAAPPLQITAIALRMEGYEQIAAVLSPMRGVGELYLRNRVLLI